MRMVLHRVAYDIGHLDEPSVVLLVKGPKNPALHRFQAVRQIGDRAIADDIGSVIQEAAVHAAMERHGPEAKVIVLPYARYQLPRNVVRLDAEPFRFPQEALT